MADHFRVLFIEAAQRPAGCIHLHDCSRSTYGMACCFLKNTPCSGFARSLFSPFFSVSSGVEVRGPCSYLMRACW
eukprot:11806813-Ditylum_brightwellii.AAC.1